jgi:hypothetical protein
LGALRHHPATIAWEAIFMAKITKVMVGESLVGEAMKLPIST